MNDKIKAYLEQRPNKIAGCKLQGRDGNSSFNSIILRIKLSHDLKSLVKFALP